MGIIISNLQHLVDAQRHDVNFDRTLVLGRPDCFLTKDELRGFASRFRNEEPVTSALGQNTLPVSAEFIYHALGATQLDILDASDFEGASVVHDLNEPFPQHLRAAYDAVVDHGTLEHVFNFPQAIKNCMEAIKHNGSFFASLPANNYCGHGFYSFSPEMVFRIFSPDNGFEIVRVLTCIAWAGGKWMDGPYFTVKDPADLGGRVNIYSRKMTLLLVEARRTEIKPVFEKWPQQSDYQQRWQEDSEATYRVAQRSLSRRVVSQLLDRLRLRQLVDCFQGRGILTQAVESKNWAKQSRKNNALQEFTF
jgi:SAM-dependent methyltransferase